MEGPSLYLAAKQLKPFKGKRILKVSGNTTIGKERFLRKEVLDVFSLGKHLVFQFDDCALRVHFLLWGTFEAKVGDVWVTGDYRKAREARLSFAFENGEINMYNCSVKVIETKKAKKEYDFSIDIMSAKWDAAKAFKAVRENNADQEIADVLLNQELFAGVGNMIKNEVLSIVRLNPKTLVENIPPKKLRELIAETREFSKQFYRWRVKFELRKHLLIHRKGACPHCGAKVIRQKTGKRDRWSYWCPVCQALPPIRKIR